MESAGLDLPDEAKDEINGLWHVGDLIKEMYLLGDRFSYYKRGLITIPSKTDKSKDKMSKVMKQCTFKPKINKLSERIE